MNDKEIIEGLIAKNNRITREFLFVRCRPLFCNIIKEVFDSQAGYDELINELYLYLMNNNAAHLKSFQYRCSVYQWLKITTIRFFIRLRNQGKIIVDESHEPSSGENNNEAITIVDYDSRKEDLQRLMEIMPNRRYAFVIQKLIIEDMEPQQLAEEMGVTTANLYNIKSHAIKQLTIVALNNK